MSTLIAVPRTYRGRRADTDLAGTSGDPLATPGDLRQIAGSLLWADSSW